MTRAGVRRQALSVAFLNPLIGILAFISTWFTSFLFSGFFLPEDDVPWPLKVRVPSATANAAAGAPTVTLQCAPATILRHPYVRTSWQPRSAEQALRAQRGHSRRVGAKRAGGPPAE
jgi:hypothetical protein